MPQITYKRIIKILKRNGYELKSDGAHQRWAHATDSSRPVVTVQRCEGDPRAYKNLLSQLKNLGCVEYPGFSDRLVQAMNARLVGPGQLADETDGAVKRSTIDNWLTDRTAPRMIKLRSVCRALSVDLNWLLYGDEKALPDFLRPKNLEIDPDIADLAEPKTSSQGGDAHPHNVTLGKILALLDGLEEIKPDSPADEEIINKEAWRRVRDTMRGWVGGIMVACDVREINMSD